MKSFEIVFEDPASRMSSEAYSNIAHTIFDVPGGVSAADCLTEILVESLAADLGRPAAQFFIDKLIESDFEPRLVAQVDSQYNTTTVEIVWNCEGECFIWGQEFDEEFAVVGMNVIQLIKQAQNSGLIIMEG